MLLFNTVLYHACRRSGTVLQSYALLLLVMCRTELDSTIAASSTGQYHNYWNLDKLCDLNDLVDKTPDAPEALKKLFGPGSTKNTRLRGNRVGQLIFNSVKEKMSGGGGTLSSKSVGSGGAPTVAPVASKNMLDGKPLTRFVFSSDLPDDCQLRVRDTPSIEGESIGVVTACSCFDHISP